MLRVEKECYEAWRLESRNSVTDAKVELANLKSLFVCSSTVRTRIGAYA